jgi:hypothetical protein
MIHFSQDGHHRKLGLNLYRCTGGFVAVWSWYDFFTYTATSYRFRLRMHLRPRIMWSVDRYNVIDNYLQARDLELVHREVLEDLNATEAAVMRTNEPLAYIKPL